jgi:homoserine O-succinyltransferase
MENKSIRIAILDLYEGVANQGMRGLRAIIHEYGKSNNLDVQLDEFDVRLHNQVPDLSYDIYISSGGPGSPLDSEGSEWERHYFNWLNQVQDWNLDAANFQKKFIFFICHSFQLACRHFQVGKVCKRNSTAFGVFPMHRLPDGLNEQVFEGLKDPFYSVDSRDYQVISPDYDSLEQRGVTVLALEKDRPHVPFERALMAIRFNEYMIGTQFHPEADAVGMSMYLQRDDRKQTVIAEHGEAKWKSMIEHLEDPDKILWTYAHILPNFFNMAIGELVDA